MNKKEFQKLCRDIFKRNGFLARGNNFYFDYGQLLLIFGLQHSDFGSYYYIEHGVANKETNPYMPWPKYYQIDRGRGRIAFQLNKSGDPQAIFYESDFDEGKFIDILERTISQEKEKLKA